MPRGEVATQRRGDLDAQRNYSVIHLEEICTTTTSVSGGPNADTRHLLTKTVLAISGRGIWPLPPLTEQRRKGDTSANISRFRGCSDGYFSPTQSKLRQLSKPAASHVRVPHFPPLAQLATSPPGDRHSALAASVRIAGSLCVRENRRSTPHKSTPETRPPNSGRSGLSMPTTKRPLAQNGEKFASYREFSQETTLTPSCIKDQSGHYQIRTPVQLHIYVGMWKVFESPAL